MDTACASSHLAPTLRSPFAPTWDKLLKRNTHKPTSMQAAIFFSPLRISSLVYLAALATKSCSRRRGGVAATKMFLFWYSATPPFPRHPIGRFRDGEIKTNGFALERQRGAKDRSCLFAHFSPPHPPFHAMCDSAWSTHTVHTQPASRNLTTENLCEPIATT